MLPAQLDQLPGHSAMLKMYMKRWCLIIPFSDWRVSYLGSAAAASFSAPQKPHLSLQLGCLEGLLSGRLK